MECKECKKIFKPSWSKNGGTKFCSRGCYLKNKQEQNSVILKCDSCNKEFKRFKSNLIGQKLNYCTNECRPRTQGLQQVNCKFCDKELLKYKSTISKSGNVFCNSSCSISYTIKNKGIFFLRSKRSLYFNKWENKEVYLESSWEKRCAEVLDELNIKWVRPSYLEWIKKDKTKHKYFPDFYLPDYNLYIDPKNSLRLKQDKEKINVLLNVNKINLLVGDIDKIENEIRLLPNSSRVSVPL